MTRNSKRLLMSFILSLTCVAGTQVWYKSQSAFSNDNGDREPMALLIDVVNEVQRKPLKRLIWQNLGKSENLFGGELVRTNEASEATIEFIKTGTILTLEPDSLISLEDHDGKIELEFLRGHLYVKGGTGDMNLKTGASRIKLAGAELALGRGGSGDGVDMQVFKGNVEIEGTGVKKVKDDFVLISPQPQSEVHVLPDGKERVKFEWKSLPKAYNVILELGKNRNDLKATSDQKLEGNKILALLSPGDYYFRLVGQPKDSKEAPAVSSVFKFRVLPKRAPVPLSPEKDVAVNVQDATSKVAFKWANPGKLADIVVEVAESADLKSNLQIKKVGDLEQLELPLVKSGTYFWRVTGYIGQTHDPVSSSVQKFNYIIGANLNPPTLELPNKGEKVSFQTLKEKGIFLQWKPIPGAQNYKMILKERKTMQAREESVPVQQIRFTDLRPGVYDWSVIAIGANKKESKPSETWTFSVEEMPILQWRDGKDQATYLYWTEKPEFFVDWVAGPKGTESYRVRLRPEGQGADNSTIISVKTAEIKSSTEHEGRYIASVEAVNKDGAVVAKSNDRIVEIKPMPILGAPQFEESVPNPLKSTRNGSVDVAWKSVEGATGYVVVLKNNTGKALKEEKLSGTRMGLSRLLPGEYVVQVRALDQGGRKGAESEARALLVPDMSDVRAPKVKTIKVE